jgi:hypothetical protein
MMSSRTFVNPLTSELEFDTEADAWQERDAKIRLLRKTGAAQRMREYRPVSSGRPLQWRRIARLRVA